jgi:hypothetical protein
MVRRAFLACVAVLSLLPGAVHAQGRDPKVYYDQGIAAGSQRLQRLTTTYFELLTTPAPEDPDCAMLRHWGPRLDRMFENVTGNLQLSRAEVYRYLLFPDLFSELEKLRIEARLSQADFDAVLRLATAVGDSGAARPSGPLAFAALPGAHPTDGTRPRLYGKFVQLCGDSIHVRLPRAAERSLQRCVLYRTLADFMATPIGPNLPEGVLGFVPRHEPERPVVVYASLGEHRLRRTAQHEIGHAVVEGISAYLRSLSVTRMLHAPKDTAHARDWRPASGGFAAITHENYAEYLAFPHGMMEPALHAALTEMVADNAIDGIAALSVGARTIASSYVEGPARLTFLAETFGRDLPKRLLVDYYTGSEGFLDVLETLTGHSVLELESLYRRWLRRRFWDAHLATAVPDTIGHVVANGWSGVRRDGRALVTRARDGRQEITVLWPAERKHRQARTCVVVRDLDGAERLPLFSSGDMRCGQVVASVRQRDTESLLLYDIDTGRRCRQTLSQLGAVREIRDPRWSSDARSIVCRVVDRAGRNAIAWVDAKTGRTNLLSGWQWTEVADPIFADGDSLVVFATTDTPDHTSDLRVVNVRTGVTSDLTRTPGTSETEPVVVHGQLVCLSDAAGDPAPFALTAQGSRLLLRLPFAIERLAASDSGLTLVANSLRHQSEPAGRAVWEFSWKKLQLDGRDADGIAALALPGPPCVSRDDPESATAAFDADERRAAAAHARDGAAGAAAVASVGAAAVFAPDATASVALTASTLAPETATAVSNDVHAALRPWLVSGEPVATTRYKQKWHLMPLGVNLASSSAHAKGIGFFGFDTEFHDQSVVIAAGQTGLFDRFGLLQYRNRTARTHWQVSGFHRDIVRSRYAAGDSVTSFDRRETETGLLLSAQYHQSLVTRLGLGMTITRRSDATGRVEIPADQTQHAASEAPVLELQFAGLHWRDWLAAPFGVSSLALLQERSPAALQAWQDAAQTQAQRNEKFVVEQDYVRPAFGLGASLSRDTRVWSDYRGPNSGLLLVLDVSGGVHTPGSNIIAGASGTDSVRTSHGKGLEEVAGSWLLLTHHRAAFVDLAFRCRGLLNDGPQALVYGLGGIYSVSGYPSALVRSHNIAWSNAEARVQLWDYSAWRVPVHSLVIPAADGFLYADTGVARGTSPLFSAGLGLRLRLGFLAFEWRHPFQAGQEPQRGVAFLW